MKVYVAHSREIDYENEIYRPLRKEESFKEEDIILPHENKQNIHFGRDFYQTIDLMIAEVSMPATGLGIELGWAYDDQIPIYCLYQKGKKVSSSVYAVTKNVLEYETKEDFVELVKTIIERQK